ncbi:unnamed protein product [Microthlaspi erraticum]|uniref:Retrotransposon gag domain-containing protein n=1 Tax=Microthlaspi erraticum TaxID=1685480 RepID=A0A6D2JAP6_9BRAS|nr:unnamed protein product [Microthlaspi erraticum]
MHVYNFESLCNYYGLGDNPKKIQLFQLSLPGRAQEWVRLFAQVDFKTWNRYKEAFLIRFARGPLYVPPPKLNHRPYHYHQPPPHIEQLPKATEELPQEGFTRYVSEEKEEEEQEYEEDYEDEEDEEQSIDINTYPKKRKKSPISVDPQFSPPPPSQTSTLPRL